MVGTSSLVPLANSSLTGAALQATKTLSSLVQTIGQTVNFPKTSSTMREADETSLRFLEFSGAAHNFPQRRLSGPTPGIGLGATQHCLIRGRPKESYHLRRVCWRSVGR